MKIDEAWGVVGTASGCSDHPVELHFNKEDITDVLYVDSGCGCGRVRCDSWCDSWSKAVFTIKSGKYVVAREDSDSSGHG